MKRLLAYFSVLLLFLACSKDTETPAPQPKPKFTITVAAGEGGSVSSTGGSYEQGSTVSVTATAASGYRFVGWSNGETSATLNIVVTGNISVTANFERIAYSVDISGAVSKGAFLTGSTLTFYELNNSLSQTGKSYNTDITDNFGTYSLSVEELTEDYARVVGEGFYWNEVTNTNTEEKLSLNAISEVKEGINVNVLTHLEYQRVVELVKNQGKSFSDAKNQALTETLSSLGIETAADYGTSEQFNFKEGDEKSKILVVASAIIQAERSSAEVTSLITTVANDLKDNGNIDDTEVKTDIAVQLAKINLSEVASNIYERYKEENPELTQDNFTSDYLEIAKSEYQEFLPDADGDGVQDDLDLCPDTPEGEEADANGCGKTQKQYQLITTVEGSGSISEEVIEQPTASYDYGTTVRLTANPINGWEFKEWKGGITSTENPVDITVVEEVSVTAVFIRKQFTITTSIEGEGTVAVSPEAEAYDFQSTVELTATPSEGWVFSEWKGSTNTTVNPLSISMNDNKEITAVFKRKQYDLTVTVQGEGAVAEEIVTEPSQYDNGTVVKLTANPSEGWAFTGWSGDLEGTENPTNITIDKAKSVTATFEKADSDGDGVVDLDDLCPDTPEGEKVNANGCHDIIYVAENGVTIKARETAIVGDTQELDGVEYTVVDETMLREMVANDEDVSKVVTTRVTDINNLFYLKNDFNQDISTWDTSNVTNMAAALQAGSAFNQDLSNWDTSKVTNMFALFSGLPKFNQDLSKWNTSSVVNMEQMFEGCSDFNQDISSWDTSNVMNMRYMFLNASSFNQNISVWDVSNVTNMEGVFYDATSYNQPMNNWTTSNVTNMQNMFLAASSFNQDLSDWDTSKVLNMSGMFGGTNFNKPINDWDVSKVTNMRLMFDGTPFNQPLDNWNVENVLNMDFMFNNSSEFNQDLSGWCVTNIPNPPDGFSDGSKLNEDQLPVWGACPAEEDSDGDGVFDINDECPDTPEGTPVDEKGCPEAAIYLGENGVTIKAKDFAVVGETYELEGVNYLIVDETLLREMVADDEDVSKVVTTKVTDMSSLFKEKESFNTNINNWDTSNVTDMKELFHKATSFNQELDHWDVSKVTNMRDMLSYTSFNKSIGQWDVSSVTDIENMFSFSPFDQPIGNWNVSNVVMMTGTFADTPFNQDISEWDVSSVQYFRYMFGTNPKFNQDISEWDVSGGVDFRNMFDGAASFNQNLSSWCTPKADFFGEDWRPRFSQVLSEYQIPVWGQCGEIYLDDNGVTIKARDNAVVGESYKLTNEGDSYIIVDDTKLREMVANDADISKVVTTFCEGMGTLFQGKIEFNQDISSWDLSNVTGVSYMFDDAESFNQDISSWNLENIVHLDGMFRGAKSFNQDITGWSFPKVTSFVNFLYGAESFNQDISKWDVSNITNMSHALAIMRDFNIDLSNWDVSNVTNMERMFHQNYRFNQDISNWDVSNVTNMHNMFGGATDFNQDLSSWCVSNIERYTEFNEGSALSIENLPIWGQCGEIELAANGVTIVANENAVIGESYKLTNDGGSYKVVDETMLREMVANDEDVTKVVTTRVTDLSLLFNLNETFNQDIESWDTSNNTSLFATFAFTQQFNQDLTYWDTSSVNNMESTFIGAAAFNGDISTWDVSNVTNLSFTFNSATSFNGDISNWDVSSVTNMESMFNNAGSFNQNLNDWNVSKVTNMQALFANASSFNGDISAWDVSSVTTMESMFNNAGSFNQNLNNWNVSKVTNMWAMFVNASSFNGDIGNWDVSSVTNMESMFNNAGSFNQNLNDWNVSKVTNMQALFANASSFNGDISAWDVSSVTDMRFMFANASSFNQNLSNWCVSQFEQRPTGFDSSGIISNENLPVWGTCPADHNSGGSGGSGAGSTGS